MIGKRVVLCGALVVSGCVELAEVFTPDAGAEADREDSAERRKQDKQRTSVAGSAPPAVRSTPAGGDFKLRAPNLVRDCQDTEEQTNPCSIPGRDYAIDYSYGSGSCGELVPEDYVRLDDAAKSVESCTDYDKGITDRGMLYLARECRYAALQARVLSQAFIELLPSGEIEGEVYIEVRESPQACEGAFLLHGLPIHR